MPSSVTEGEIRDLCREHLAKALARPIEAIDPNTSFARLGVDSAMAVYLVMELEDRLGLELAPEVMFEHPSIAELARHLVEQSAGKGGSADAPG